MNQTTYVALCNHQLPQSALQSKTPIQAMKDWYASHPHLFVKRPYDHPGCDSYEKCLQVWGSATSLCRRAQLHGSILDS
jgi:hypothetical protein